mmetsp:Transcript_48879/g.90169  ORF Transcript_48879/g.90169 Transcript_48879/m.90169 type:complete len:103 (+) Transcript_48879:1636-1944(+)
MQSSISCSWAIEHQAAVKLTDGIRYKSSVIAHLRQLAANETFDRMERRCGVQSSLPFRSLTHKNFIVFGESNDTRGASRALCVWNNFRKPCIHGGHHGCCCT